MPEYTVLAHNGQRPWKGQKGSFIDHNLTVSITEGTETRRLNVVVTQKPETRDPEVGSVIYGHLETQEIPKKDGTTFTKTKLKKDQNPSGPRGGDVAAFPSPQASPDSATRKSADTGGTFDTRSARIERQHSQEMALRAIAILDQRQEDFVTEKGLRQAVAELTDWFVADLDNASPSPQAEAGAAVIDSGNNPGEAVAPAEATPAQKRKVTTELNNHVAPAFHDELRKAARAHTKAGASALIDGLQKMDAGKLLTRYGIASSSDVPADTEGLPPADPEVEALAGQYDDSDIPF